jgi:hypothetical protein
MFKKVSFALATVTAVLVYGLICVSVSVPAYASDVVYPGGGTLSQIVDGGGTHTIITLVNLDIVPAPYILYFYADSGNPLTLSTTAGTGEVLTGVLPVGGSKIIQTNGSGGTVQQGYAVVLSESASCSSAPDCQVAGSAVFGIPLAGNSYVEASCPLDTGFDYIIAFPFDQTTATTGVALANSYGDGQYQTDGGETANLAIAFYDENGNNYFSTTLQLAYGQHTAFNLPIQYPQTANTTGTMVISSTDTSGNPYAIKTLGLRATNTTFTSITPVIPCNYSSYYGSCTN